MKTPAVHTKKLDDRSQVVVHFGREPGTKAYRLFDPVTRKIHISRDVVFDEGKAWNWDSDTDSDARGDGHFVLGDDTTTQEDDSAATVSQHESEGTISSSASSLAVNSLKDSEILLIYMPTQSR